MQLRKIRAILDRRPWNALSRWNEGTPPDGIAGAVILSGALMLVLSVGRKLRRRVGGTDEERPLSSGGAPSPREAPVRSLRIALLIDGDNAQPSLIPSILKAVGEYGPCVIQRVYGDWSLSTSAAWRKIEQAHAVQLVQQSRYVTGKNSTDMAIVIAAMDIMHTGTVNAFCIVSSDSDFTPLVMRLKDQGMTVIGVGRGNARPSFVNACSVFLATDRLSGAGTPAPGTSGNVRVAKPASRTLPSAPAVTRTAPPHGQEPDPRSLLIQAYNISIKQDGWVFLGTLGDRLRQIDPKFQPGAYGCSQLSVLVARYPDMFEMRSARPQKGGNLQTYIRLKT